MIAAAQAAPRGQETKRPDSRRSRLAAIREVRLCPQASTSQTVRLRRLLEQIELCSAPDGSGSHIRQATLAARLGVAVRSLRRWLTDATDEGLIETHDSWTIRGRDRVIKICWDRVIDGPGQRQLFFDLHDDPCGQNQVDLAACNGTNDRMAPAILSASYKEDLDPLGLVNTLPPPPSDSSAEQETTIADQSAVVGSREEEEWEEVRELVEARGVSVLGTEGALRLCRSRGVQVWAVHAVLRFYDLVAPAFGPGALQKRLCALSSKRVPEANWQREPRQALACWPASDIASAKLIKPQRAAASTPSIEEPSKAEARQKNLLEWESFRRQCRASCGPWWDAMTHQEQIDTVNRLCAFTGPRFARRRDKSSAGWEMSDMHWLTKLRASLEAVPA